MVAPTPLRVQNRTQKHGGPMHRGLPARLLLLRQIF
jgi:hypothetical protein